MVHKLHTVVAAHSLAVTAACLALSAFGAWREPRLGTARSKAVSSPRSGATMLAIVLTLVGGIALDLYHPLAVWTAALVASGLLRFTPRDAGLLTAALLAATAISHWL